MAEQEIEQQAQVGGKKNIILFGVALVLAISASVGGTFFFLNTADESPAVAEFASESNKSVTAIYYNMRPAFIVNYLTGAKPRYLQAEFTIMSRNAKAIEASILHMPLIRSEIISFLTEKNFLELQTQEGKEEVRRGIVVLVNDILGSYDVRPGIESALITNFVLQ